MYTLLLLLFYLVFPALVIKLCNRFPVLGKIGPIFILYFIGIVIGNTGVLPGDITGFQEGLTSVIIPVAIPLMLFSCNFRNWSIRNALVSLLSGLLSVTLVIVLLFFLFRPSLNDNPLIAGELNKLSGMLVGVYTGGTPNLAALKIMLHINNELYILANAYDMIVSIFYFSFLFTFGIRLLRKWLPFRPASAPATIQTVNEEESYDGIFTKEQLPGLLLAIGTALAIVGISAGASLLFTGKINIVLVILLLTTLGIGASFIKPVYRIKKSFSAGMYLIYIFSLVIATMADLSRLNFKGGILILAFIALIVFGSLLLQTLFSRIFKIDADTLIVSSVALINAPPFVPMIAAVLKNKDVILTGMTVGLAGYALGNYLGFLLAGFLGLWG